MSFKVAKSECLDFSPPLDSHCSRDKSGKENSSSIPVLSLLQFSRAPFVSFGTIKLGSSKSLPLRIENPTDDATATVIVDKISASKGFSVDQMSFTIQPEDSIILTVTWTPVEEGGIRELLCFIANGIVKHQAILLGKAETTKKKKKTLWDSIKSKKGVPAPSKEKKVSTMPIKSVNKTFHVSRQSQYRKDRTSNPLSPLNQNGSRRVNTPSSTPEMPKPAFITETFDNVHLQKDSPVVVLVPAERLLDTPGKKDAPSSRQIECREITRVLNKTLSPASTPERFRNPLSSGFQSPLPVIGQFVQDKSREPEKLSLSVKDALDVIGSDLSHTVSPPNACSSFDFSDSLESDKPDPGASFRARRVISPPVETADPRLTFCVKPNKAIGIASNQDEFRLKALPFSTATVTKSIKVDDTHVPDDPKTFPVNSATVVKSKADASVESPGLRKKKTSRRRLLEKTLELSEPSNAESNTSSPDSFSALPVINSDSSPDLPLESKICPVAKKKPTLNLSPHDQLLSSISPIRPQVFPSVSNSPSSSLELSASHFSEKVKPNLLENQFPVQSRTLVQSKKRKSDEFLRGHSEDKSNIQAKKCRAPAQATEKPSQERTLTSRSTSGPQRKAVGESNARSVKSANSSTRKTARIVAVAQARLTFMKPTQTAIPRHPLPFAAKNMFYDERWIEKQERGFTWWMNYILTPDDFKVATEVTKVNALSLTMGNDKFNIPKAPTKEEMSFRTYTARQRLNRLRRAACKLFTSEAMVKAIQRLELEVEAKRLLVRKDRHLWKDIGERQKVLNWLISYNPLWLRIGLETIYGELISLESNNDVMGLAMFILGRLLWNPDLAAEFRHSKVPHLYRDGHEEALSRFTLKKLILLVCFLDKAKESRLIEHDPCLFCMDAEFKSSKDLLLAFSRDFLSGEGILSRHLSHLGLAVSHVQTPLDEFNFAVKKLAVDLKCGIRLVRVMELFTLDWTLSRKLRIPAISRLQKVHNVDLALQVLKNKGVDLRDEHGANIDSRDIVDGHREKTLNLLWKIIFAFQVEVLLDENQLKEEISFLRKTWRTKQKLASIMANNSVTVSRMKARRAFEHPSQKVTLLMDWVNAVCEFYSLKAENFTVSFSDGRILCYLIHHYHPGHLHAEEIQQRTTQTIECGHRGRVELNNSSSDSDCSFENLATMQSESVTVDFRELLENEKSNFQLVNTAVSYLGGVPAMINPEDMSNTIPNEKVVTCYLSFLCARLLDLRNETRAARVIQGAWRRYKLQKDIALMHEKNLAATKIQALARKFILKRRLIRQNKAAVKIQTLWRGYSAREKLRVLKKERHYALQNAAATLIQKTYKAWRVKNLLKKNRSAFVIQAAFRKWHAKKMLERNTAALRIQAWYRMQLCKRQYLEMKRKAVCVQAWFRGHLQRSKFQNLKKRHHASVVIQSAFRAYLIRKELSKMKQNAVLIQRWFRACVQRKAEQKRYFEIKSAVLVLQAAFRGWKVRKSVAQHHRSALVIQTAFRRFTAQRHFLCLKRSAIVLQQRYRAKVHGGKFRKEYMALKSASVRIQAMWRGRAERKKISQLHRFAKIIQSNYRRHLEQTRFLQMKRAAVVIQRQYRAFRDGQKVHAEYTKIKRAAIILQSAYRGRRIRQELQRKNKAATLIQSVMRAHMCHQQFLAQKHAAIVIQQQFRAFTFGRMERSHYMRLRKATITMQAIYRGSKVRQNLKREHQAATVIQAQFRMHKVRIPFVAAKCAAILIQQHYRAYKVGKTVQATYLQMKNAAVVIQSAFRGMKVRNYLRKSHQAAKVIQAHFRGHSQLKKYRRQQWAASVLQQRFRATVTKNAVMKQYAAIKTATICIQSAFRGMVARKQIAEKQKCAKIIQKMYRAYKQRHDYLALRNATIRIQQQYRAVVSARQQHQRYCSLRAAAITLQSSYRGLRARKEINRRQKAATVIQAAYKMYRTRVPFQAMKLASLVIQRQYRCHLLRKKARENFLKLKQSAVAIQAIYRGKLARRDLARRHFAATIIQRKYLAYKQRKCFLTLQAAVIFCQQHYRSILLTRHDRKDYLTKRRAVVAIQASFRGMNVRRQIRREHKAATIIQSHVRMRILNLRFQRLRWAVCTVQQRFRANKIMRQEMAALQEKKSAALILQAAYRGKKTRQALKQMHQAATIIQSHVRMRILNLRFQRLRWAVCTVQERFRANRIMRQEMAALQEKKSAALILQAAYRGKKTRQALKQMHQAATIIQSHVRMRILNLRFQRLRWAVCTLQRHFRANKIMRQEMAALQEKKSAALILQAAYRGMKTRHTLKQMHQAATIIQSHVRMRILNLRFQRLRWAVCTVQQRFRANRIMRQEMAALQEKKSAALILQAAYRGMKTRQTLKQMHQAATIVQATYRAYSGRKRYLEMKCAAIDIQQRYRAVNAAKQQRKSYLKVRQGALVLQACYRGRKVRRNLQLQCQAAVLIQSYFRRHKEMVKYQAMKLSAVIIQSHFRSYIQARADRKNYQHLRKSAIVIQAAFRGHSLRRHLARKQEASVIIQASFRMYQQRSAFKKQRWAARVLQQRFRALKLRDEHVCQYQQVRNAAVCLQRYFRGMKGRELARRSKAARTIQSFLRMSVQRQRFMKEKAAAIAIQSAYRGHFARAQYTRMQAGTVLIQKWYRSRKLVQEDRKRFVAVRQATLTLQSALRGMLVRRLAKRRRAAIKIQSVMRMHIQRKRYVTLRASALKFQAHYRMLVAQRKYRRLQAATVTLQKHYRSHRATLEQRCSYLKTLQNIKKLQARVRGHIAYKRFQRLRTCAITIQANYRGMIERRRFHQLKECALVIQKHYRAFILCQKERSKFLQLRQSAVVIQRAYRAYQKRQNAMKAQAALKIQAWFRGRLARRNYILKQAASATIRRCIQARRQRSKFLAVQHSVRVIQQRWRETLSSRKQHAEFLKLIKSVIYIQALWRGRRLRDSIQKQATAAVKIQSAFRGSIQRRRYHQQRNAAITLQRHFRVLRLARVKEENLRRRHNAAIYIQALWRGWLARQQVKEMAFAARRLRFTAAVYHHLSAIKIQRAVRAHWALKSAKKKISSVLYIQQCFRAKLQRKKYLKDREDIIKTQRAVRSWLHRRNQAASIIQHAVRKLLFRRRKERLQRGIIRAQALWRGHCSRKLHDTNKVISMRQRLREVNQRVKEEDKLCNKTTTALTYLLGLQNYAFILAALKHLETATRLSPECCERLVESGATHTIFTLIRSCNRSVPSMEIITLSIQVLLNLSKYHRTIDAVYDVDNSVETLLDLLQIYREKAGDKVADKGGSIFTKTCFLLVLLVQDERRAMEIRRLPKVMDRIRSIYRLTLRKCKMDAERNKVKQKMNTSLNGSFLLQATPRKSKPVARFAPDWVLRRDKMKDIVDPLRAIQILANALAIVP
ncbi:abnormal spindle-like microcephaly-associated protein [Danio rerio]|uniref:Abnormal spindle-like microcephaly-associated protein n=1 Tax=Danio rerio TaxID=7955 RepID=A0A0R4INR1_DANRE|nr:abnormal spindle-like microcephaly-associated protein [Danio rerio]|eukprot:NP_001116845.1 abnormal spindle-like microcephaly-associated protein [Danio rerio]